MEIELMCLGVGAGKSMVYDGQCSSSFVIIVDKSPLLLIDIGFGVVRQCKAEVNHIPPLIYVTHNHGDHAAELPVCLAVESQPKTVIANERVISMLKEKRLSEITTPLCNSWLSCQSGQPVLLAESLSLEVHQAQHSLLCFGFVLYFHSKPILGFSGDSGYNEELYDKLFIAETVLVDARLVGNKDHASFEEVSSYLLRHDSQKKQNTWIYHYGDIPNSQFDNLNFIVPRDKIKLHPK